MIFNPSTRPRTSRIAGVSAAALAVLALAACGPTPKPSKDKSDHGSVLPAGVHHAGNPSSG